MLLYCCYGCDGGLHVGRGDISVIFLCSRSVCQSVAELIMMCVVLTKCVEFQQYFLNNIVTLFSDSNDVNGKRVMVKVDSRPGRLQEDFLAKARTLGFIVYPGVPNNTAVTRARRLVITVTVLVWDDKMCQAAEILMVHENCVSFFWCGV